MPDYDHEQGAARADLCRFLAACYYQPGPEFAEEKVFDSMTAAAARISPQLAAHARQLGEAFAPSVRTTCRRIHAPVTRTYDMRAKPYGRSAGWRFDVMQARRGGARM